MPRTGSFLIAGRGARTPSVVHAARAHGGPGGEADRGSRRRRRAGTPAGTPRCRRCPWPASGSGPGPGTSSRAAGDAGPGSSSGPDSSGGQAPGTSRQCRPAAVQLVGTWLPGAPAPCPGITLSDTGGQEERAHCRWYGRGWRSAVSGCGADPMEHSVRLWFVTFRWLTDRRSSCLLGLADGTAWRWVGGRD